MLCLLDGMPDPAMMCLLDAMRYTWASGGGSKGS